MNRFARLRPSPVPSIVRPARYPRLTELLEDAGLVLGGDADAGVGHRDGHIGVRLLPGDCDRSTARPTSLKPRR
jgi:hypothetical protein